MNNTPENENLQVESTEEFSTIFSAPTEHKKKAPKGKKGKRLAIVISAFLVVALLVGGTFGIIKLIPEKETETSDDTIFEEIEVLSLESGTLETVTITNENGTYKLYSVKEKSDTSSSTSSVVNWYIDGIEKDLISTESTSNVVFALSEVSAFKEITKKSAKDCGLEPALATAELVDDTGKTTKILLGEESPDGNGSYFKVDGNDKIYLVDSSVIYGFTQTELDLADNSAIDPFPLSDSMSDFVGSDGLLGKFEKLTITGKNFPTPVVIEENSNKQLSELIGYVTTSPTNHIADGLDEILEAFKNGISVSGTYSFDKSDASIKKFGLDNPDFVATMEISGVKHTYKFKLQEDDYYAVISSTDKLIQKVDANAVAFTNQVTKDFYSSWVCLISIDDLKSLDIKTPEKSHNFEFTDVEDEDSDIKFLVDYNGKKIDTPTFQDFYMALISIPCNDYTIDNVSLNSDYSFTFKYKSEKGGQNVIDFVKVSETRYQYYSDGVAMGKVSSSELKKVINILDKITQ